MPWQGFLWGPSMGRTSHGQGAEAKNIMRHAFEQHLNMHERNTTMKSLCKKGTLLSLMVALLLTLPVASVWAFSVERQGTVLLFFWEDAAAGIRFRDRSPSAAWDSLRHRQQGEGPDSWMERQYQWGEGLGVYGFAYPGT